MDRAFGIWIYGTESGGGKSLLEQITDYNAAVPETRKVRYLYPYCLTVDALGIAQGKPVQQAVFTRPELEHYSRVLPADLQFYPMIDGSFYDREKDRVFTFTHQQAQQLAEEIAQRLQPHQYRLLGIHLDLESLRPEQHTNVFRALQERVAEEFSVPLSIATGRTDLTDIFSMVDHAVLMCYDLASPKEATPIPPVVYADRARGKIESFVQSMEKASGYFSLGLPFVATHKEYEFEYEFELGKNGPEQGKELPAPWKMEEYVKALYDTDAIGRQFSHPQFLGLTIWNLRSGEKLQQKIAAGRAADFGPRSITEEGWKMLICRKAETTP